MQQIKAKILELLNDNPEYLDQNTQNTQIWRPRLKEHQEHREHMEHREHPEHPEHSDHKRTLYISGSQTFGHRGPPYKDKL